MENFTTGNIHTSISKGYKYALNVARRQPMTTRHVEAIREIVNAGLIPIILVGSTNTMRSRSYDPLKNPLSFAEQVEQIKRSLDFLPDPIIISFEDLNNQSRWCKALATLLEDPFALRLAGLEVSHSIKDQTLVHYTPKNEVNPLSTNAAELNKAGLSTWASGHVIEGEITAKNYIDELCRRARAANPDAKKLNDAGITPSLLDLSLMKIFNESNTRTSNLMAITGQEWTESGLKGAITTFIHHNRWVQEGKRPIELTQYLSHQGEKFDDKKGSDLLQFLFHPATLLAIQSLGSEVLHELVPQGGFSHFIPEMKGYNKRMALSMKDKVDYIQAIEGAEIIVDFGCANGAMLKYLKSTDPDKHYIGYDVSQPMIDLANTDNEAKISFTTNWDEVTEEVKRVSTERGAKNVLVLSSLIHEVYSYLPKEEVTKFWDKVWNSDFDYVAVRDMMVSDSVKRESNPDHVKKIRDNYEPERIAEWEKQWGPLEENRSMIHFLLTCPYKENWARELQEDYLPFSMQEFIKNIPEGYEINMVEHYTLPFFRERTGNEFGLDVPDNTHIKIVLQKARGNLAEAAENKTRLLEVLDAAAPGTQISGKLSASGLKIEEIHR